MPENVKFSLNLRMAYINSWAQFSNQQSPISKLSIALQIDVIFSLEELLLLRNTFQLDNYNSFRFEILHTLSTFYFNISFTFL